MTSKRRLAKHLMVVHGFESQEIDDRSKAELQRAHGWIRADRKCRWRA